MNEDTLILYYYNDGLTENERRDVEAALEADPGLAAQYEALCAEMGALTDADVPPAPAQAIERWHAAIGSAPDAAANVRRPAPRSFNPMSFAWGVAVAAALVIGINLLPSATDPVVVEPAGISPAFARGVQVHFRDTYDELASLSVDSNGERAALVLEIIEQNRMFQRAAGQNGADDVARVLRAFEPILVRLAAEDTAPEDAEALRAQLAFELNVMLTKLSRDSSNETDTEQTGIQT